MEKNLEISLLLDFYGQLLTDKQQNIMRLYFDEDTSLTEIANMAGVSRQAVHDIINRSTVLLNEYEQKLKLANQFKFFKDTLKDINAKLEKLKCDDENIKKQICKEINNLIYKWEE